MSEVEFDPAAVKTVVGYLEVFGTDGELPEGLDPYDSPICRFKMAEAGRQIARSKACMKDIERLFKIIDEKMIESGVALELAGSITDSLDDDLPPLIREYLAKHPATLAQKPVDAPDESQ